MSGDIITGQVGEDVAEKVAALAREEASTPAVVVGQATRFYVELPDMARSALRSVEQRATPDERRWFEAQLVRLLVRTELAMTRREMASQVGDALPRCTSEEELEAAALEWTAPAQP